MTIDHTVVLLLIAAVVALIARRLHLPYTVGLVLAGIGLSLARMGQGAGLTPHLIMEAFLPPLLFEAALTLRWRELRRDGLPIFVLSTLGVAVSALLVTLGMVTLAHWPWTAALLFGVLIAATDPVSVIATFRENKIHGRVRLLVEAESLFNDGVAAVFFALALTLVLGESVTPAQAVLELSRIALGGIAVGLACGGVAIVLAGRTEDALVETALTAVAAYGSFLLAAHLGFSGVLATVSAGLLLGNAGVLGSDEDAVLSQRGREVVIAFWDFAAFAANSLIFLLIGLDAARRSFAHLGLMALTLAIGLTLLGRAAAVYPLSGLFARSQLKISYPHQHLLFWGGMRGALALALALSLPQTVVYRDQIILAAFGVVAFSVIVQGITMPLLLKRLKI
ncbi:MAG: cation:proton antiporter [Janthinobacterium lividum]